jgi:hypothetical protein
VTKSVDRLKTKARLLLTRSPAANLRRSRQMAEESGMHLVDRLLAQSGLAAVSERRLAKSLGPAGDLNDVAQHIAARLHRRLYAGIAEAPHVATALAAEPMAVRRTVEHAGHIVQHEFDLLGSGVTRLGKTIDWNADFKHGHRWTGHPWHRRVDLGYFERGYDVKVPWELSRMQQLTALARAHALTGDPCFVAEFCTQVADWCVQNPAGLGVTWACTMDVAIRAANILWAWAYFARWTQLPIELSKTLLACMLAHGTHIMRNLEGRPGGVNSNHYLTDVTGLLVLGLALPEMRESSRWSSFAVAALEQECRAETLQDGVNHELSTNYHRLVTELFLCGGVLCRQNGRRLSPGYWKRVHSMLQYVHVYTRTDGSAPLVGDVDSGRLFKLQEYTPTERGSYDHRHLLAAGSALFREPTWAWAAGDQWEEAFWLLGSEATRWKTSCSALTPQPEPGSRLFPDAGVAVLRAPDSHCVFTIGGRRRKRVSGHCHNDQLGLDIKVADTRLLVDPGTYVYTADMGERDRFRSTRSHSTVELDGREIEEFDPDEPFEMRCDARAGVAHWRPGGPMEAAAGWHDGYARLPDPAVVHRAVVFDRGQPAWAIRDRIETDGVHDYCFRFHIASGEVEWDGPGRRLSIVAGQGRVAGVLVILDRDDMAVTLEPSHYAPAYGYLRPSTLAAFRASSRGEFTVTWALVAGDPADAAHSCAGAVRELNAL